MTIQILMYCYKFVKSPQYKNMKRFGEKLRTLRKRHNYTLRELGDRLGVNHTFVSQLEFGKSKPNAEMILKIADLFGVDLNVLMRDELDLE